MVSYWKYIKNETENDTDSNTEISSQSNVVWAGVKFVCLSETNDGLKMEKYKCDAAVLTWKIDLRYFLPNSFAPENTNK